MEIKEICEVLNSTWLKAPKHILVVPETITETRDGIAYYAGITPMWRGDVIVLGQEANKKTVLHELIHTYGFGELAADLISNLLAKRRFKLMKRNIEYQPCNGNCEFPLAHSKNIKHYIKR
jgi:hypothetical protein